MKINQAKQTIIKLINEYSTRDVIAIDTDAGVADYYNKLDNFIDMAQYNVASSIYIKKVLNISHILPLHISESMFKITEHNNNDLVFSANKAYAFSFFADRQGKYKVIGLLNGIETILVEETDFGSSGQGFTNYKGIIDNGNIVYDTISLVIYGDYYFNVKNVALYNAKYADEEEIPKFDRYVSYKMPNKFFKIISAQMNDGKGNYNDLLKCEWESPDKFMISAYARGDIRITYASYPQPIVERSEEDELEVKESCHNAVCYYAAALVTQRENITAYYQLMQQYEEVMINQSNTEGFQVKRIKMVR